MDFSPPGSSTHGDSPGKKSGLGCYALLPGIFQTQGLNPGHLHCRRILHHLRHQGRPLSPRVCSDLCPLSQWCYLTVSFSATFSLSLQCFPSSGSLPVSQLFTSGGQSLELQLQHQSFQWIFSPSVIQQMLAIWSLVPLTFLSLVCISGSSNIRKGRIS